jgi:hypothetical protein
MFRLTVFSAFRGRAAGTPPCPEGRLAGAETRKNQAVERVAPGIGAGSQRQAGAGGIMAQRSGGACSTLAAASQGAGARGVKACVERRTQAFPYTSQREGRRLSPAACLRG